MIYRYFLILSCLIIAHCSNVQKGYKIDIKDEADFQTMVDRQANMTEFLDRFGSPSFVNSPINDTICYVEANGKKIAFNRFYKPTYRYQCIVFEKNRAVKLIKNTITKIEKQKMTKYDDIKLEKPL